MTLPSRQKPKIQKNKKKRKETLKQKKTNLSDINGTPTQVMTSP
jgi:hypothetical protein